MGVSPMFFLFFCFCLEFRFCFEFRYSDLFRISIFGFAVFILFRISDFDIRICFSICYYLGLLALSVF